MTPGAVWSGRQAQPVAGASASRPQLQQYLCGVPCTRHPRHAAAAGRLVPCSRAAQQHQQRQPQQRRRRQPCTTREDSAACEHGGATQVAVHEQQQTQQQPKDWLASANTLLQQQLPAESSLQQLLEPLLPAAQQQAEGAQDGAAGLAMPGGDVAAISAPSTSLTVGGAAPSSGGSGGGGSAPTAEVAVAAAAMMAAAAAATAMPPPIDVEARDVPRGWRRTPEPDRAGEPSTAAFVVSPAGVAEQVQLSQQQQQQAEALKAPQQQQQQPHDAHRHWARVVGVCGFAALLCYLDRTNISTAIVPMAEQFGWNKQFCSIVMSAFFAGYGATQVWGGQLSDRYGGSAVLAAGLAVWSLATVLTPLAASAGTWPLLAARAVLGMGQGIAFPAIHALLAKKVPGKVRSGAIGIIMALAHCGTAMGFGASPGIIDALGWGWTFYLFGGAALLWVPLWLHMARDKGNQAARTAAAAVITLQRQQAQQGAAMVAAAAAATRQQGSNNIVSSAGLSAARPATAAAAQQQQQQQQQQQAGSQQARPDHSKAQTSNPNVGFWPLMRRKEVWAIAVAQYAAGWGFYGLLAWLPQFFISHCGLQLSQLGGFTLAPYLLQALMGSTAGLLADNLIVQRKWAVRDVRVLMQAAGMLGPAACLFAAASPLVHNPYVATGLITLGMGLSALTCSGVSASHLDIAPRHAGVIFGVGNTSGTLAGLVAVPGLGYVLQQTGNWSLAFGLAAVHNVIGAILWAMWVGDKPLPEDGSDEAPAAEQQQQQPQPLVQPAAVVFASEGGLAALKLKAA